ncbi:sensor histidine kinase [Membranihabitans maritimus]|uniref:sensor histidine kinase n=1 Tax=Membranihabitans maritimus TaxID=2904244 RepID=UPI001F1BE781|nr:HAMP domain-containing sensor histidine kinase [Membranihabitans maritimus]
MDIYHKKNRWKLNLVFAGIVIVLITIAYTFYLANELRKVLEINMENLALAYESIFEDPTNINKDVTLETDVIEKNNNVRIIIVNETDSIQHLLNFPESKVNDRAYLRGQLEKMKNSDNDPILMEGVGYRWQLYYAPPLQYKLLSLLPLIILLLLAAYVFIGYLGFSTSRSAEQNRVWVGMARETAHQLGTPISAIIAWLEHLKTTDVNNEQMEIVEELQNDVNRLELIADRFSKIGAAPNLTTVNIFDQIEGTMKYMQKRAPRKVNFILENNTDGEIFAQINVHLFNWVIENLMRNALDAMEGKGEIKSIITEEEDYIEIEVSDTGKGISSKSLKTVFEPGYTTKKRGWGLGLSLAKRIIENYHKGKIYVKKSIPNEGTTFAIKLPKDKGE